MRWLGAAGVSGLDATADVDPTTEGEGVASLIAALGSRDVDVNVDVPTVAMGTSGES